MTGVDRRPTLPSSVVAVAAAILAFLMSGPYDWVALAASGLGVALVAGGVLTGRHAPVTAGSAGLIVGVLAAAVANTPPLFVLGGAVAAVVAWDAGGTAIDLGNQLGRGAGTTRLELVHVGSTALVGAVTAVGSLALYRTALGRASVAVPMLLVIAALCIAVALTVSGE
ncbi:hypothetical protein SAMN05216559_1096 [Halomicrobium zhouii]|uniref:Uncharacterized protein n=1 Tax=Halomicrobium zhouii TaxID=767519 RepID=A0A1I6KMX1_9EURY|nr:hypothetical protein [Halomicrobium zhouii]SFR92549.1 hypothetical protein SAMN05216559_1096 [Halomicrobium zhouii]